MEKYLVEFQPKDISEAFEKQHNIKIDKKKIDLKETIKTLGIHTVSIKLFEGVIGKIKSRCNWINFI